MGVGRESLLEIERGIDYGDGCMKPSFIDKPIFRKGAVLGELLIRPFQSFASIEASSGILLLAAAAAAIIWVNLPFGETYDKLWQTTVRLGVESRSFDHSLHFWINDGLMAVFFFVVGLEIKREMLVGELASFRRAALPMTAAIGGMAVPALIFLLFNYGTHTARGWAIPTATDIALTLGALIILGRRVPRSLMVFVVALAIADDLGAVLVIALFYTAEISVRYLAISGAIVGVLATFNVLGYRRPIPYLLMGLGLWYTVFMSGVHSTLAGILLAMTIPARSAYDTDEFLDRAQRILAEFECAGPCGYSMYTNEDHQASVETLERLCHGVQPPLIRIEYALHPWVVFLIVPLFGLANAGVHINWAQTGASLLSPLSLGIALGLFVGKPVGIVLATWLAVATRVGELPQGVSWTQVTGGALLCGIGFTMSLFITHLSFAGSVFFDTVRMAILLASVTACAVGMTVLFVAGSKRAYSGGTRL